MSEESKMFTFRLPARLRLILEERAWQERTDMTGHLLALIEKDGREHGLTAEVQPTSPTTPTQAAQ